ncbi:hypothetical protein Psta_3439 [Pirellula staleyi DSM 6068]|uniref:Uncharacterized protein n=1 Tax=Pirellula staleyi (strain ATCC 27377 / DSM 6068 / ICPB 4128) TaxID=530564 RepID=D2QY25_PIRSD|nr:hypothetical protein [Pirellula staleyi]ADB18102.1 hypothetical protein Psta_3439 [Pirellula staleyi DSM 6068]
MTDPFELLKKFLGRELARLDNSHPRLIDRQAANQGKRAVLLKVLQLIEESEQREAKRRTREAAMRRRLLKEIERKL